MIKNINSRCHCGNGLPWIKEEVIMLEPCEHLIHKKCFTTFRSQIYRTGDIGKFEVKDFLHIIGRKKVLNLQY